jgi:hypothetical protein
MEKQPPDADSGSQTSGDLDDSMLALGFYRYQYYGEDLNVLKHRYADGTVGIRDKSDLGVTAITLFSNAQRPHFEYSASRKTPLD